MKYVKHLHTEFLPTLDIILALIASSLVYLDSLLLSYQQNHVKWSMVDQIRLRCVAIGTVIMRDRVNEGLPCLPSSSSAKRTIWQRMGVTRIRSWMVIILTTLLPRLPSHSHPPSRWRCLPTTIQIPKKRGVRSMYRISQSPPSTRIELLFCVLMAPEISELHCSSLRELVLIFSRFDADVGSRYFLTKDGSIILPIRIRTSSSSLVSWGRMTQKSSLCIIRWVGFIGVQNNYWILGRLVLGHIQCHK